MSDRTPPHNPDAEAALISNARSTQGRPPMSDPVYVVTYTVYPTTTPRRWWHIHRHLAAWRLRRWYRRQEAPDE